MGIYNIQNNGVSAPQQTVQKQKQQPHFKGNSTNYLERIPQSDEFEKGLSTGAKVGIATGATLALLVVGDFLCAKGRHVKKLLGMGDDATKIDAKKYLDDLENEAKTKLEQSNKKNSEWLEQQHKLKEEEYSNWWNSAMKEKDEISKKAKKDTQEYLENEEKALKDKVAQSNKKNEEWVQEQRNIREAEYSDWWNNALKAKEEAQAKLKKEAQEWLEQHRRTSQAEHVNWVRTQIGEKVTPLKKEILATENEIRTLYRKMSKNEPITIEEADALLKKYAKQKAELNKLKNDVPNEALDILEMPFFRTAENLQSQITHFKMNQSIVNNFGQLYKETSHEFMEHGNFDDTIVRAYKNLKDIINNPQTNIKESEALVEKAKKLVSLIESKSPKTIDELKESKLFNDDILQGIQDMQTKFNNEQYLKMQQEINEMIGEKFNDIINANIR